jgi:hypothetical protein
VRTGLRPVTVSLVALLLAPSCGPAPTEPGPAPPPSTVGLEIYLANDELGDPCGEVFPVPRQVDADDPVTGALQALLAGPTEAEEADGYGGWFSEETADTLLDVEVVDGTAHVTFTDLREVIPNASTSCGSATLLAQLDRTLLALDGVEDTRYALADQAAFYAWLQLVDPDEPSAATKPEAEEPASPDRPDPSSSGDVPVAALTDAVADVLESRQEAGSEVVVSCDRSGTVEAGDVLVCAADAVDRPETDWGAIVVAVVDASTFAFATGTDNPGTEGALLDLYADTPHGLRCRDLLSDEVGFPFGGIGMAPEQAFFWSLVYWNLEGQPARMDADGDGVPCGTLYEPDVISAVLRPIPR